MLRSLAALTLAASLLAPGVRAAGDEVVLAAPVPPPEVYAPVVWEHGSVRAHGWWYTDAQVVKTAARIQYLETQAAKACVDEQVQAAARTSGWWKVAGGLAAGIAVGYCAGTPGHCGLYK